MKYYSFAGPSRGTTDPASTFCIDVDESCDVDDCAENECDHLVIMWSGAEYSKDNTWIAAEEGSVIDLQKAR